MKIETVVAAIPYEKDPYFPFQYSLETLAELEARIGRPLPEDVRWYLANVGWRKIDYGQRTILVRRGEYLHDLEFEAAENQVFALNRYDEFVAGREGGLLPHDGKLYVPFGQVRGGNPQVSLRLLFSLNDENGGSIWAVRTIGYYGDQNPSQPIRIADDLASFLERVGPDKTLAPVAKRNNEDLFQRLLADYAVSSAIKPTVAAEPAALIAAFLERPGEIVFDGARNVEYQYRRYGQRYENAEEFAAAADRYATKMGQNPMWVPAPLQRLDIRIGAPQVFDRTYEFNQRKHGYQLVTVESRVGDGNRLREEYLLHHDKGGWTLLRRHEAVIDDVRVKGVGTFAFDSTYKWKLKKKVQPAWSELAAELRVAGEEDALTQARIAFVKEVIAKAEFKPVFEAYVYKLYTEKMYPEFEAMSDEEKQDWADSYPRLSSAGEIWRLLGKKCAIEVTSDTTFDLAAGASWDPEHGLTLDVRDWRIEP